MDSFRRSVVLDTSAFIAGFDPLSVGEETYTVPEVETELIDGSMPKLRFITSVESGKLIIVKPLPKYIDLVRSISSEIGDSISLSETDISVLALAVQLREGGHNPIIMTDDYSIQNTAEKLGLKYTPLTNLGIRYHFCWILYCPACGRRYTPERGTEICENCGIKLERKPKKRTPVKGGKTKIKSKGKGGDQ